MRREGVSPRHPPSLPPSSSPVAIVPFVADNAQFIIRTNQNRGLDGCYVDAARLPFSLAHLAAFVTTTVAENRLGEVLGRNCPHLNDCFNPRRIHWVILWSEVIGK